MISVKEKLAQKQKQHAAVVSLSHSRSNESAPVFIEYCVPGNYKIVADELRYGIEREFGVNVRLIPSRAGVFEVTIDGRLVFSKRATHRLPDADEVFYHLANRG